MQPSQVRDDGALISRRVSEDDAHRGNTDDRSVRAFAVNSSNAGFLILDASKLSQSRKAQNCLLVMAAMRLRVLRPLALSYRCSVLRVPPSQANLTIADRRRRHALHRGRCPRLYPGIVEGSWPKKKRPPVRRGLALFIAGQGHQSARRGRSRPALVRHYCSLLMSMSLTESSSTEKSTATMVASLPITTAAWLASLISSALCEAVADEEATASRA